jgi:regulator of sigma E protease
MNYLTENLPAFLFVLGVTIFVHEFGHFITAKMFGIRVFVFSFGFGHRLFGFKWGDTDCRLSLIPLGGYVKLEGEEDDKLSEDTSRLGDGRDFTSRPRWQRIIVYLAGPFMNGVLTVTVLSGVYMRGAEVDAAFYDRPVVGAVEPGSPAEQAGFKPGDEIVAIDGTKTDAWPDVHLMVAVRPEQTLRFRLRRLEGETELVVKTNTREDGTGSVGFHPLVRAGQVTPGDPAAQAGIQADDGILRIDGKPIRSFEEIPPVVRAAVAGKPVVIDVLRQGRPLVFEVVPKDGKIGVWNKTIKKKFGFASAVVEAFRQTAIISRQTLDMLRQLVTARISPKVALSGPVGIFQEAGKAARSGAGGVIMLLAIISLSVGVLNLLPWPPLDGGHLAILFVESILRRDLSPQAKIWIMNTGVAALLLLIAVVFYFDIAKMDFVKKLFAK